MAAIVAYGLAQAGATGRGQGSGGLTPGGLCEVSSTGLGKPVQSHTAAGLAVVASVGLGKLTNYVKVLSAVALSSVKVRITFDRPMLDDSALRNPSNYTLHPTAGSAVPIYYTTVEPESVAEPTYVDISTSEMTDGLPYEAIVFASGPTDPEGTTVDPANNTVAFTGIGIDPEVLRVEAVGVNRADVIFTEAMDDNAAIRDISHYAFDGGLSALSVLDVDGDTVKLVTSNQTPGVLYTLTITN
jgi:hypothetical protein